MNRLIYSYDTYASIFFPPGRLADGGTCEFATPLCLQECYERPNAWEVRTYDYMVSHAPGTVSATLLADMEALDVDLLFWFDAGDCPHKHTGHILAIMRLIARAGVVQIGFTRNVELWRSTQAITNTRMVLTCEKGASRPKGAGVIAVPDYQQCAVSLYQEGELAACGGSVMSICANSFTEDADGVYENDCEACRQNRRGCFVGWQPTTLKKELPA